MLAAQSWCALICLAGWLDGVLGRDVCRLVTWGIESEGAASPPYPQPRNGRQRAAQSLLFPESALGQLRGARPKQNLPLQW